MSLLLLDPWLELESIGEVTVVRFTGGRVWQEEAVQTIGADLLGLVSDDGQSRLVLNFDNVEGMTGAMLGKLVTLHKRMRTTGGRLVLCRMQPLVADIFDILKLSRIFVICGDEEEAIGRIGGLDEDGADTPLIVDLSESSR